MDEITITINAQNNYEIKDSSITFSKINTSFLSQIQNLGVDWNQNDPSAGDYVRNKPVAVTQTANGFMSKEDKIKLDGIESNAEVNVQSDWSVTDSTADSYIKNKPAIPTVPTALSAFTNDVGYVSDISGKLDKTAQITAIEFVTELPTTPLSTTLYFVSISE